MPEIQNLPISTTKDKTYEYFNNYYTTLPGISSSKYDSIVSFFQNQTQNIASAKLLAQAVIDTANYQKEDPLNVLEKFKNTPDIDTQLLMILYLNSGRINTSLLGMKIPKKINKNVERQILF
jgi:hypothetical protein